MSPNGNGNGNGRNGITISHKHMWGAVVFLAATLLGGSVITDKIPASSASTPAQYIKREDLKREMETLRLLLETRIEVVLERIKGMERLFHQGYIKKPEGKDER